MAQKETSATRPITDAEILQALDRSGYPFEIELLTALDAEDLDPSNGFRLRVADGPTRPLNGDDPDEASSITRETDVMARVHVAKNIQSLDDDVRNMSPVSVGLLGAIEAKTLPPNKAFVGFTYKAPPDRRPYRARFAGAPCNWILPQYNEAHGLALDLASALDPINDAPYCVQWAVVERTEKGGTLEFRANHPWAPGLVNLVRGLHLLAVDNTKHLLAFTGQPQGARVDFYEPTLFIKTPNLYLFDVTTRKLTTTTRLSLGLTFELFGGEQQLRLVDVWTGDAVNDFARRYKAVRANFEEMAQTLGVRLVRTALEQRKRFQAEQAAAGPKPPLVF